MRHFPKTITIFALIITISVLSLVSIPDVPAQTTEPWAGILYSDPNFQNMVMLVYYYDTGLNINWGANSPRIPPLLLTPTPVPTLTPSPALTTTDFIGISKSANIPTDNSNGTYTVTYTLNIENHDSEARNSLQITDNLSTEFGTYNALLADVDAAGEYTVANITSTNLAEDTAFTGGGATENLLLGTDNIPVGAAVYTVSFDVTFYPALAKSTFINQATASATGAISGNNTSDDSDDNTNPDPDGDGNPNEAGENDSTSFTLTPTPVIGVSKSINMLTDNDNGTYTVTYTLNVENLGNEPLNSVQVTDNLSSEFGTYNALLADVDTPSEYTIANITSASLAEDTAFTGGGATENLLLGTDSIPVDTTYTVNFDVTFYPDFDSSPFLNQATASATGAISNTSDTSDDGTNPDPDGDGNPNETGENDTTSFDLSLSSLLVPNMPVDNFSARFSTNWYFDAGIYEFTVIADGGVRLSIENNVIFNEIDNHGLASFTGTAFIGSGPENITIDYVDYAGDAILQITWREISTTTTQNTEPVVQSSVATAQVIVVDGLALRTGPYLGASLIGVLRPGTSYTVIAQNNTEGDHTWYKLVTNSAGQTGWASGRYLEVDLQSVTERDCSLPLGNAITIAEQIVPGFSDATLATQCLSTAADVLNNNNIGSEVTSDEILKVTVDCNSLLSGNSSPGQVLKFMQDARLILAIKNVCTASTCTISDALGLEIKSQIAPSSAATSLEVVVCMNSVADAFDGNVSISSASSLASNCAGLLLGNSTIDGIFSFLAQVDPLLCTETSVPTIVLPEESSVFENLLLPDTGVTLAPRSVMNIRVRPSTRVASAGQLPWGAEAQVLARTIQAGEAHWYLIRYAGIIGWVDASFVNIRGNINDVPIY